MKKLIFVMFPTMAFATPGVSANKELLYFEIIILSIIGLWLGTEYGVKWLITKIKQKLHKEPSA